jgi:hypothetical protein
MHNINYRVKTKIKGYNIDMSIKVHIKLCKKYDINQLYVYIHKTNLGVPFYVGKGSNNRAYSLARSKQHKTIRENYGFNVEIVYYTYDLKEVFDKEIEFIALCHTYVDDQNRVEHCCNFNKGGLGGVTPSKEVRLKISKSKKGQIPWNKGKIGVSDQTRERQRNSHLGKERSQESIEKARKSNTGKKRSKEFCDKLKEIKKNNPYVTTQETRNKQKLAHANPVYQIDITTHEIIKEYSTPYDAFKQTGIYHISGCANRNINGVNTFQVKKFIWIYVKEYKKEKKC